jgi:ubiquinone/menaquinone biosynthesis C-methylase UbiE
VTSALIPVRLEAEYEPLVRFFDEYASSDLRWRCRNRTYHRLIEQITRFHVPPGRRVLEIGCGSGDLLASLEPAHGVGIDISPKLIELGRQRHPELELVVANGEALVSAETFDYVVLSDLLPYVADLEELFARVRSVSHPGTRVVVSSYSRVWRPAIHLAEALHLKPRKPIRNWVSPEDAQNLLHLAGFEVVVTAKRILLPKRLPVLATFANAILANLPLIRHACLTYWIVARPAGEPRPELSVSVICPCRNEQGHIPDIVARLPEIGVSTELIFVEGGSSDDTRGEIERQIARHPEREIRLVAQPGRGKGDAVRAGFAESRNDVLMILDGDLTVAPEDLPKFYRALVLGRGELINGSRLVYDIGPGSMQALNVVGNKLFSYIFRWTTGQHVKDTLCGTKVLHRDDYARIAEARQYFGDFDPFGDFDLLYGASRLSLRIVDVPVRYGARAYGTTNISRFRHGWLLLRMSTFAFYKFRVRMFVKR